MILNINIKGLKRFRDERFAFAPLTVLTGLNGSGKSSLIHALFLAREASSSTATSLPLNGPYGLQLGTANDVLNWDSEGPIEIAIDDADRGTSRWEFVVPEEEAALFLSVAQAPALPPNALRAIPRTFTFLSAERLGPRSVSKTSSLPENDLEVGRQGEFCAHVLEVLGGKLLSQIERSHPLHNGTPRLLKYEVEQWLTELARPIEVDGMRPAGSTVTELRYRSPGGVWVRATNMGFGVTYALPIILGGLIAEVGGLIVVENPEAHLHPAGQSRMGVFLAWLVGKGVQVIVETHSDHILNGMRRAVAEHHYLNAGDAIVHYFNGDNREDTGGKLFEALSFTDRGSVSAWPAGFFDQYQIDVASLGQIRRQRD